MLLHTYPFQRTAGYLAQMFAHVYVDVGLAVNHTGAASDRIIAESLELAPFRKVLFSSDAWGLPELHLLGSWLFRRGLVARRGCLGHRRRLVARRRRAPSSRPSAPATPGRVYGIWTSAALGMPLVPPRRHVVAVVVPIPELAVGMPDPSISRRARMQRRIGALTVAGVVVLGALTSGVGLAQSPAANGGQRRGASAVASPSRADESILDVARQQRRDARGQGDQRSGRRAGSAHRAHRSTTASTTWRITAQTAKAVRRGGQGPGLHRLHRHGLRASRRRRPSRHAGIPYITVGATSPKIPSQMGRRRLPGGIR